MNVPAPGEIEVGDKLRWFNRTSGVGMSARQTEIVTGIRGYEDSEEGPLLVFYVEDYKARNGERHATFERTIRLSDITYWKGRKVSQVGSQKKAGKVDFPEGSKGLIRKRQPTITNNKKEEAMAKKLATTTRKSLDDMSEQHRAHIEKWEPHLKVLKGEHVWAAVSRVPGRGIDGPMYVALKRGSKDYAIVDYNTETGARPKVLADGFESSTQVMAEFSKYRQLAKKERASATTKPTSKVAKKAATTKAAARRTPSRKRKPVRSNA